MSNRELTKIFRRTRKACKTDDQSFKNEATELINILDALPRDLGWAQTVGEVIPRLFARDVKTGYALFHDQKILSKVWEFYQYSATEIATQLEVKNYTPKQDKRCKVACITGVFWDDIAPTKAIADFALNLDSELYEPILITTNQFFTHERKIGAEVPGKGNTNIGHYLDHNGIDVISLSACESNHQLAQKLIEVCQENEIDIAVSNGSLFSFPDACLAASGVVGSFYNMHQGFPLYGTHIDAICHFIPETRETQLSLWESKGGQVIDYDFGIPLSPLPPKPDNAEKVFLITSSNHLKGRLSAEYCQLISEVMIENTNVHYTLLGNGNPDELRALFPGEIHPRIECPGAENDQTMISGWLRSSDIYVNEFPVGGGRSLLEAMSAELPVVAMRCGKRHVENIGATLVGPEAIQEYSPKEYKKRLSELINKPEVRTGFGQRLRKRVEDVYDIRQTVKALSAKMHAIHLEKRA